MMKCFINEKNNKIKSILKGVGEIPRFFSENMLERVYINEHTRKSDERTDRYNDRYRRQYTGFISSRFGKNVCAFLTLWRQRVKEKKCI